MGMETGLLTLFLLLGVLSSLDYTRYKKRTFLLSMSVYLGMAYLTRNDSLVFAFLVWLFVIWEILELNNFQRHASHLTGAAILYVLFVIGQGVFQFLYYGEWMPNTYTLKLVGMSLLARLKNGVRFIIPFLKGTALLLSVSYLDMFFDFQKKKVLLLSIITSAIAYQIYVGGDPWRYWRIMSPSVPLLFILFVYAIYVVVKSMSETAVFRSYFLRNPLISKRYVTGGLVFIFAVLGLVIANSRFLTEISLLQKPYTSSANQRNVNTAIAINELTTNNASVGVFWAGSIPYYTGKYAIDFLGKSDKHIAKLPPDSSVSWNGMDGVPGHNKYDLTYSIQLKKPTYVQGFKWGSQDLSSWSQDNYTEIKYKGVNLFLLKEDHSVLWSKVDK
jgi:hypothetical protein